MYDNSIIMGYSVRNLMVSLVFHWLFSEDHPASDADTLFWRLSKCASLDLILQEYKKAVKRNIEAVKRQIRGRRFIIAIDETYEPFTGRFLVMCDIIRRDGA